jgi:hypothetical protein
LCPRRDEKKKEGKLSKGKLYSKIKLKKKRESRKRSPISSSRLFFYAAHDRRDRFHGPHLVSQKKSQIQNIKGSRAADEDTKDKEIKQTGALTKKKNVIALAGRLQARSPADR